MAGGETSLLPFKEEKQETIPGVFSARKATNHFPASSREGDMTGLNRRLAFGQSESRDTDLRRTD